jgi:hypothetical protein
MTSPTGDGTADDPADAMAAEMAAEMAGALAEFTRQRDELAALTHRLETTTIEVTSPDGLVTVTSTLSGAVTGLRFPGEGHRELTGTELAVKLLETLTRTRESATAAATEAAGPLAAGPGLADTLVPGDPLGDALAGLDALFRSGPSGPAFPDRR